MGAPTLGRRTSRWSRPQPQLRQARSAVGITKLRCDRGLTKEFPCRSVIPAVPFEHGKSRTREGYAVLGVASLADVVTISERTSGVSPRDARYQVHIGLIPIRKQDDRREPVARRLKSTLRPEDVATDPLGRDKRLDGSTGRRANIKLRLDTTARLRDSASEGLQALGNDCSTEYHEVTSGQS
jgi:hypothetical protein